VSDWGARQYGDPCRECGFDWSISTPHARALVESAAERWADALHGFDGTQRHPDLAWTAGGYVCHVVDNLRIWAERLAGATSWRIPTPIALYDTDLLAQARAYEAVPVAGALWSLRRAVDDWSTAVAAALAAHATLDHPERGRITAEDVVVTNAHDSWHHEWDVARSLPPAVVFLPGMGARGSFWDPLSAALPAGWEMASVDWPGLGDVAADPSVRGFDDLVDLVLSRLRRPSILIAQSMGGVVAVRVAQRAPHLVTHLVLSATSGGIDLEPFGAEDWRPQHRRQFPDVPSWGFERPPDLTDDLRQIAVPTLLLWATDDPISPIGVGQRLAELIPDATLATVVTDDHRFAGALDRTAEVAAHILNFRERAPHPPRRPPPPPGRCGSATAG
jgi:pimeloyl-ACP methyl ester carboxylesterase